MILNSFKAEPVQLLLIRPVDKSQYAGLDDHQIEGHGSSQNQPEEGDKDKDKFTQNAGYGHHEEEETDDGVGAGHLGYRAEDGPRAHGLESAEYCHAEYGHGKIEGAQNLEQDDGDRPVEGQEGVTDSKGTYQSLHEEKDREERFSLQTKKTQIGK